MDSGGRWDRRVDGRSRREARGALLQVAFARQPEEHRAQALQRTAAVAEAVLLGRFELGQGPPGRLVGEEERVVAEPVRAPRRVRDAAIYAALGPVEALAVRGSQRDGAEEVRRAASGRDAAEVTEQLAAPALLGFGEARAAHAGPALQRVHAQPAVVGERPERGARRAGGRLGGRVLLEGRERLLGRLETQVGQRDQVEIEVPEDLAHLRQLAWIGSRDQELHFASCACASAIAAVWARCRSWIPFCASATIS